MKGSTPSSINPRNFLIFIKKNVDPTSRKPVNIKTTLFIEATFLFTFIRRICISA